MIITIFDIETQEKLNTIEIYDSENFLSIVSQLDICYSTSSIHVKKEDELFILTLAKKYNEHKQAISEALQYLLNS